MRQQVFRAACAACVGAALAALSGCGGGASQDPQVMQRFQSIETKLAEVRNLPLKVEDLDAEFQALEVRVGILEKDPAKGGAQALATRLEALEKKLTALETRISSLDAEMKKLAQQPAVAPAKTAVTLKTGAPPKAPETPAKNAENPAPKAPPKAPEPTKPPAPVRKGVYFTPQPGDTLQAFAARHQVTVEAVVQENHLLKNYQAQDKLPIQSYWLPIK